MRARKSGATDAKHVSTGRVSMIRRRARDARCVTGFASTVILNAAADNASTAHANVRTERAGWIVRK